MSGIIDHLVSNLLLVTSLYGSTLLLDYVDDPATEADEGPWILKLRHLVCRNSTIFVCQAIVTLALLAAVEVLFEARHG